MEYKFKTLAREEMDHAAFKQARTDLGLSVRQLAEILNTNEKTVRLWESGKNDRPVNPIAVRVVTMMIDGMNPLKYVDVVE